MLDSFILTTNKQRHHKQSRSSNKKKYWTTWTASVSLVTAQSSKLSWHQPFPAHLTTRQTSCTHSLSATGAHYRCTKWIIDVLAYLLSDHRLLSVRLHAHQRLVEWMSPPPSILRVWVIPCPCSRSSHGKSPYRVRKSSIAPVLKSHFQSHCVQFGRHGQCRKSKVCTWRKAMFSINNSATRFMIALVTH